MGKATKLGVSFSQVTLVLSWGLLGGNRLRIFLTLLSIVRISRLSRSVLLGSWFSRIMGCLFLETKLAFDEVIVISCLFLKSTNDLLFPVFLSTLNIFLEPLVSLDFTVVSDGDQLLLKISEGQNCILNVEIVEHIGAVSLQWYTVRTDTNL